MKPRILVLAEYYLPGYRAGGPVRSVSNLVEQLADDFDWLVITRDRDFGDTTPYSDVAIDRWIPVGYARVFYASPQMLRASKLLGLLRDTAHDMLYLNSFFAPRFSLLPQWGHRLGLIPRRPLLLAPRGEFSPGALALKAWKKRLYLMIARMGGAYSKATWHASSPLEAEDIVSALGVAHDRVRVARNLGKRARAASASPRSRQDQCRTGGLRLCFLSRLTRKKNLSFALDVLRHVLQPVTFTIYGPNEDEAYWVECRSLIDRLPPHVRVHYAGPVPNTDVPSCLAEHDLFFLPSAGENFGHVIVEAWAAGLPVLISDRTPWRNLQAASVGWDLPLDDPLRFAAVIDEVAQWSPKRRAEVRGRSSEFAARHLLDEAAINANRDMFRALVEQSLLAPAACMH